VKPLFVHSDERSPRGLTSRRDACYLSRRPVAGSVVEAAPRGRRGTID